MQSQLGISEINANEIETNRPYHNISQTHVQSGSQEMALFNQVEPGSAGNHKMEAVSPPYAHAGQYNPSVFPGGASPQANPDPYGTGYDPTKIDANAARSLMSDINKIDGGVGRSIGDLDETDLKCVSVVIDHITKLVELMGPDLDLWVPDDAPKLYEQLTKVGTKLIPFLNKYADSIRKLGE